VDKTRWTEPLDSVRRCLEFESGPGRAGLRQSEEEQRVARGMGRWDRCRRADWDAADYGRCPQTGQRSGPGRARWRAQPSGSVWRCYGVGASGAHCGGPWARGGERADAAQESATAVRALMDVEVGDAQPERTLIRVAQAKCVYRQDVGSRTEYFSALEIIFSD